MGRLLLTILAALVVASCSQHEAAPTPPARSAQSVYAEAVAVYEAERAEQERLQKSVNAVLAESHTNEELAKTQLANAQSKWELWKAQKAADRSEVTKQELDSVMAKLEAEIETVTAERMRDKKRIQGMLDDLLAKIKVQEERVKRAEAAKLAAEKKLSAGE